MTGCTDYCMAENKTHPVFTAASFTKPIPKALSPSEELQQEKNEAAIAHILENIKDQGDLLDSNIINVLALDGGGIKGVALLQILIALEDRLEKPLKCYFDWIAGTSTGSIVASAMMRDISLRQIQKVYFSLKNQVFGAISHSNYQLEMCLQRTLGEFTTLADISYPRIVIPTLNTNTKPSTLVLQRNYRLPADDGVNRNFCYNHPAETKLWLAVRRSTAAPTYFKPSEGIYIDGGLAANNPSLDLLTEIHSWNRHVESLNLQGSVKVGCFLSIGCGVPPVKKRSIGLLASLLGAVIEEIGRTDGFVVDRDREACHALNIPFFRVSPDVSEDIDLATRDNTKIIRLMWDAFVFTETHKELLDEIADLVKKIGTNEHRQRLLKWDKH